MADFIAAAELMKRQEFDAAEGTARACIKADPRYIKCYLLLGAALVKIGRTEEAAQTYRRYLELAPTSDPDVPKVKKMLELYEKSKHDPRSGR